MNEPRTAPQSDYRQDWIALLPPEYLHCHVCFAPADRVEYGSGKTAIGSCEKCRREGKVA
jgi:hypothetical protein